MQLVAHQNALYCVHLNWCDEIETVKRWRVAAMVICLSAALWLKGDFIPRPRLLSTAAASPPVILWAWEEPEDLRGVDVHQVGVAFLAERLFLGSDVQVLRRRQRILVPDGVWAEAVVRIESVHGYVDTETLRAATAHELLRAAALPNVRSLQVDFDATERQRLFYADVLQRVRAGLPHGMGLTMTALVSWCSGEGGWLSGLPVDEAVPMYFRLGKHMGRWGVREPLCMGSLGLSTDEPGVAPEIQNTARVYLFAPRPWTADHVALVNRREFPVSAKGGW
jgi:hypothetical protein